MEANVAHRSRFYARSFPVAVVLGILAGLVAPVVAPQAGHAFGGQKEITEAFIVTLDPTEGQKTASFKCRHSKWPYMRRIHVNPGIERFRSPLTWMQPLISAQHAMEAGGISFSRRVIVGYDYEMAPRTINGDFPKLLAGYGGDVFQQVEAFTPAELQQAPMRDLVRVIRSVEGNIMRAVERRQFFPELLPHLNHFRDPRIVYTTDSWTNSSVKVRFLNYTGVDGATRAAAVDVAVTCSSEKKEPQKQQPGKNVTVLTSDTASNTTSITALDAVKTPGEPAKTMPTGTPGGEKESLACDLFGAGDVLVGVSTDVASAAAKFSYPTESGGFLSVRLALSDPAFLAGLTELRPLCGQWTPDGSARFGMAGRVGSEWRFVRSLTPLSPVTPVKLEVDPVMVRIGAVPGSRPVVGDFGTVPEVDVPVVVSANSKRVVRRSVAQWAPGGVETLVSHPWTPDAPMVDAAAGFDVDGDGKDEIGLVTEKGTLAVVTRHQGWKVFPKAVTPGGSVVPWSGVAPDPGLAAFEPPMIDVLGPVPSMRVVTVAETVDLTGELPLASGGQRFEIGVGGDMTNARVLLCDFDGDGVSTLAVFRGLDVFDLAQAAPATAGWGPVLDTLTPSFSFLAPAPPAGVAPLGLCGDSNNDGKDEAMIYQRTDNTNEVFIRPSTDPVESRPLTRVTIGEPGGTIVVGDWDGQGGEGIAAVDRDGTWTARNNLTDPSANDFTFTVPGTGAGGSDSGGCVRSCPITIPLPEGKILVGSVEPVTGGGGLKVSAAPLTHPAGAATATVGIAVTTEVPAAAVTTHGRPMYTRVDPSTGQGQGYLREGFSTGEPTYPAYTFPAGQHQLLCDWDGDGVNTPASVDITSGTWTVYATPPQQGGTLTKAATFRLVLTDREGDIAPVGVVPVCGDWNGDGIDTPGLFRNGLWSLFSQPVLRSGHDPAAVFDYGTTEPASFINLGDRWDRPVVGDWDGDGIDTIGTVRDLGIHGSVWTLCKTLQEESERNVIPVLHPAGGVYQPVVGDWDSNGTTNIGIVQSGRWYTTRTGGTLFTEKFSYGTSDATQYLIW